VTAVVAGSFALDALEPSLQVWSNEVVGGGIIFRWLAYGELTEALKDATSPLHEKNDSYRCNVLLVREEGLCRAHPEDRHAVVSKRKQKQEAGGTSSSIAADAAAVPRQKFPQPPKQDTCFALKLLPNGH
jgi:hypothetical protein